MVVSLYEESSHMFARKRFGQNFLIDQNILYKMVTIMHPQAHDHFVEIGPGHGELTQLLLPEIQQLDAIEIDRDLVAQLQQKFANDPRVTVHSSDVLKFDFRSITPNERLRICGNLPYNISTPLLFKIFLDIDAIQDMHFLLQKEVVQRLCAEVGSSQYGRLSVMTQYFCDTKPLFTVGPNAFRPVPKVDSAMIRLVPHDIPIKATHFKVLSLVVREAFSHRRKTLRNSLKNLVPEAILHELHISPTTRPQEVTVTDYVRISNAIAVKFPDLY